MTKKGNEPMGIVQDWNLFETAGEGPDSHSFPITLEDLIQRLRELVLKLDPAKLAKMERELYLHIDDFNNPHKNSLEKMGTSVLNELYKTWKTEGNEGTVEEFLKILFQYVKIADMDTHYAGVAMDEVASVFGLAKLIERHNNDLDAHQNLMGTLFPGAQIDVPPSFSLLAEVGVTRDIKVVRASEMSYVDKDKIIRTVGPDILPVDYSYDVPMFSIWDQRSNMFLHSNDFVQDSWIKTNVTPQPVSVDNAWGSIGAYELIEVLTEDTQMHAITQQISLTTGLVYTVSVVAKKNTRNKIGFELPEALAGPYCGARFDLETGEVFLHSQRTPEKHHAEIIPLFDDWYLCWYSFSAIATGVADVNICMLDILDGDFVYIGDGVSSLYIGLAQIEEGLGYSGYIPSTDTVGVRPATTVMVDAPWWNGVQGTMVCSVKGIPNIQMAKSHTAYMVGNGVSAIAMSAEFPITHKGRWFFSSYKTNNTTLTTKWSTAGGRERRVFVHSYDRKEQLFGATDMVQSPTIPNTAEMNKTSNKLYIGCNRSLKNQFNGMMSGLWFYPVKCTAENLNFLVNGVE